MFARFLLCISLLVSGLAFGREAGSQARWHWPKEGERVPALLLVTSERGVNSFFTREIERWVEAGYGVLAIDLFEGKIPKDEKEANRFRDGLSIENTAIILEAALAQTLRQPRIDPERIGLLSWGVGASHSLRWLRGQKSVRAAALVSANPMLESQELAKIRAKLFLAYPKNGGNAREIAAFESALKQSKISSEIKTYEAKTALFMDFSTPASFEASAAEKMRADVMGFLGRHAALKEYK